MDGERRELRSWSIEPRDRRVHAVSPMHLQEGRILNSLLHEAHNISSSSNKINAQQVDDTGIDAAEDTKLQQMISKYQSQVIQQQLSNRNNHELIKSFAASAVTAQQQMPPMSHSQPCLITINDQKNELVTESVSPVYHPSPPFDSGEHANLKAQLTANQNLVRALQDENSALKQQCDFLTLKASRLQQLEKAYETIEKEYENLTAQKERQDNLEKAARMKMEQQIARYASENEMLRMKIAELIRRIQAEDQSEQINKLNLLLSEIIPQNKELMTCKERQKMDIEALEVTLKDQRNHIQILEKALGNAQEKAWRREKEVEELTERVERAESLQKAVEKSMFDKRSREDEWNRERAQLEMENAQLKMQLAKESVSVGVKKGSSARNPESDELTKLKKTLHAKEDAIAQLEKNVIELEAKFHEEIQRNKMAIATQSDTLSGKLKKMEEEKSEKDRKIAELTEEKERLSEKLEDERKSSESRTSLLEREIDRIRNSDDRRFREDMARMEQMRLKIADRRCFTTERSRNRCVHHGRTSSGTRAGFVHIHLRANSATALLPTDLHLSSPDALPTSADIPLDLSNDSSATSAAAAAVITSTRSTSKALTTFRHSSSCQEDIFADQNSVSDAKEIYGTNLNGYTRPISIPPHYDLAFSDSKGLYSKISNRSAAKSDNTIVAATIANEELCGKQISTEEIWDV
uniref:Angiomotin C-terminal domain-containing protein n=1 Tax=Wuchereria bancrofti TaxID=6293 RepID=A0AAF5PKW8_WUCBA